MDGKIRNYYVNGNTAKGYWSFYQSNVDGMEKIFILNGVNGSGKSTLIKKVGLECVAKGYDIELMHDIADNDSLSGIIIPALKACVIDGSDEDDMKLNSLGVIVELIDLNSASDKEQLAPYKDTITKLETTKQEMLDAAYDSFSDALQIHDEWEKIFIENMDFPRASELTKELEMLFLGDKTMPKKGILRDRFMGGATPTGPKDYITDLTSDINKRYFIKGRPGTGKSTLLKRIAKNAEERGFEVEVYHCGFDPNSLDMLIFRELDLAIFDSTAPHEYFPTRDNDEIIDMYKEAVTPGTDEKYALELQDILVRYQNKIAEGTSFLNQAKILNDTIAEFYTSSMDFEKVEELQNIIMDEILALS